MLKERFKYKIEEICRGGMYALYRSGHLTLLEKCIQRDARD